MTSAAEFDQFMLHFCQITSLPPISCLLRWARLLFPLITQAFLRLKRQWSEQSRKASWLPRHIVHLFWSWIFHYHRSVYPILFYLLHGTHMQMTTLTVYIHLGNVCSLRPTQILDFLCKPRSHWSRAWPLECDTLLFLIQLFSEGMRAWRVCSITISIATTWDIATV